MNCPHCHAALTAAEVKALWSAYTSAQRRKPSGGRKPTCNCGKCRTCLNRAYMRKRRAAIARKAAAARWAAKEATK